MKRERAQSGKTPQSAVSAFVSYSRRDSDLAERLVAELKRLRINAYLDRKDIAPGEAWRDRIGQLIAGSDAVVFVLSPDSVSSEVCGWEVAQAHDLGKRLLPLVGRDLTGQSVPKLLSARNYIFCRSDEEFTRAAGELAASIVQDIDLVREQTRLAQLAHNWISKGRSISELLRADALVDAEQWAKKAQRPRIKVGRIIVDFIKTSRLEFDGEQSARAKLVADAFQSQSDYLAARSTSMLELGDPVAALYLAIESMPDLKSRFEEHRSRPVTARSVAALVNARRYLTRFEFLEPQHRMFHSLHASPDGAHFCGIRSGELTLISGSAPFNILRRRQFATDIRDISFSSGSERVAVLLTDGHAEGLGLTTLDGVFASEQWTDATRVALDWSGTALFMESNSGLRGWSLDESGKFSLSSEPEPGTADAFVPLLCAMRQGAVVLSKQISPIQAISDMDTRCLGWSTASDRWVAYDGRQLSLRSLRGEGPIIEVSIRPGLEPLNAVFSGDGMVAAVACRYDSQATWLILPTDGRPVAEIATNQPVETRDRLLPGALTGDGSELITVAGKVLSRWETWTGRLLGNEHLPARLNPWSERPELIVSASPNSPYAAVLLDSSEKSDPGTKAHQVVIFELGRDDGRVAYASSEFDAEGAYGLIWSPDGAWFVAFGHSTRVVIQNLNDPRIKRQVEHKYARMDDGVRCAAFSPGQRMLLSGSCDGTARLWNVASGVLVTQYEHPSQVSRVDFSRDGVFVVTLDDDKVLRVFPAGPGEAVHEMRLARETTDIWIGPSGDVFVREWTGRLRVLPRLLDLETIFDQCCSMLPRGLSYAERIQMDLSPDFPHWSLRYHKWPSLLGESGDGVTSIGQLIDMLRTVTVQPARTLFRDILSRYSRADICHLATMALMVWHHFVVPVGRLSDGYNLSSASNADYELAAEIFDALVEIAEEYRSPELPLAMVSSYRGPPGGRFEKWRRAQ